MDLAKLLAVMKPKPKRTPKCRPIYLDDVCVGWDDGLPNSVKLDAKHFNIEPEYIIFKKDTTIYALNGRTKALTSGAAPALIQGAIDTLKSTVGRGKVFLVPDSYDLGTTGLKLYSGIKLRSGVVGHPHYVGAGAVLNYEGTDYAITFEPTLGVNWDGVEVVSVVSAVVEGLQIKGTSAGAGGIRMGNATDAVTKCVVKDSFIWNFTAGKGIFMDYGNIECTIRNVRLFNNKSINLHIKGGACNSNLFERIYISNYPATGIGVQLENETVDNLFVGCNFELLTTGVYLKAPTSGTANPRRTVFINCEAEANTTDVNIESYAARTTFVGGCFHTAKITDNGIGTVFINVGDAGATGSEIGLTLPKTSAGYPKIGSTYFDSATNKLYIYNGTAWVSIILS